MLFRDRNHISVILLSSERDALYYVDVAHDLHRTACGTSRPENGSPSFERRRDWSCRDFSRIEYNNGRNALMPQGRDRQTDTRA